MRVDRDLFYKLASDVPEERIASVVGVVGNLEKLSVGDEGEKEWVYVVDRLVKGLESNRNSARLGFSMCLTEALHLVLSRDVAERPRCLKDVGDYLKAVDSQFPLSAVGTGKAKVKVKGKDERGTLFGRLFAYKVLLNEPLFSLLFDQKFLIEFQERVIQLGSMKNWLLEPCFFSLYQAIEKLLPGLDQEYAQATVAQIDEHKLTMTNEGLSVYLLLAKKFTLSDFTLENSAWKANDPLQKGNLSVMAKVMLDTNVDGANSNTNKNWAPRLHYIWDIILREFFDNEQHGSDAKHVYQKKKHDKSKNPQRVEFKSFWQAVVDESFFNDKASPERKYQGYLIFQKAVESVPASEVEYCFTQNIMRSMINQASDSKRMLNKLSQKTLNTLVSICESEPAKLTPVLTALLFSEEGSLNFDILTKSKTVSRLLATKQSDHHYLATLIRLFTSRLNVSDKTPELEELNPRLKFILDSLLNLIRSQKALLETDKEIVMEILESTIQLAFFQKDNEYINNIAKERLSSMLAELIVLPSTDGSWPYLALEIIVTKEKSETLIDSLDDSLVAVKAESLDILKKISELKSKSSQLLGIESLMSMNLIQLYSGDAESIGIIEDLTTFYHETSNHETANFTGVTEILLSLLAQRKSLLRKLSLLVWEQFIDQIGKEEINLLLNFLHARENKEGFSVLFENEGDYEVVDSENDAEGEEDDENNEKDNDDSDEDSDDDVSDDDDASLSSSDTDNADDEKISQIDKETTSALAKALNLPDNIINENGEVNINMLEGMDEDDDDDSSSAEDDDESMDDEKMMELDDQLSEIFKRRKDALSTVSTGNQRKLDVKESRENVIAFKHRIIDMLEIYIKHIEQLSLNRADGGKVVTTEKTEQTLAIMLAIVDAFANCVQQTLDKPLIEKIIKLFKGRFSKIRFTLFEDIETSTEIMNSLERIHIHLNTNKPGQFSAAYYLFCSSTSLYLCRFLIDTTVEAEKTKMFEKLVDVYAATTKIWMQEGKYGAKIFVDFYNWLASKKQRKA
ncbi:hypothetical protein TPHA_0J00250 [Tetrapisispora phaffii CBS 4417]|uniref:DNA polymerase V n=1 Tax=Tetrapisispora phaffii (strain ATCC 24235 / CBS 4417 / NBRC 1672 / NRRL Y-8282 / UCD 70-5) TaxID=1071381 RepID=G8BYA7_TETPH|nr:hypothetical protein TPHA_0J00250 [Tetrapisispora phaffii CBS 4417]CCE64849.1 hypothetical protein TPHA_0J00250 [Tetrapisispora phaffii CBS 4417]